MPQQPLLQTKLFVPPVRPGLVPRPRLTERLNAGLGRALTLLSAPAGFGKTTLLSEWVNGLKLALPPNSQIAPHDPVPKRSRTSRIVDRLAWLSLDESDNDPTRFLVYLITALSQVDGMGAAAGAGAVGLPQCPHPPPAESVMAGLINEMAAAPGSILLVLDDYHLIEAQPVHDALTFLLEHQPPQLRLVVATREDPPLPLARLRARGQLTELRAADLRFSSSEVTEFLNRAMGLGLSAEDIAALESRTEGWIAGLQLASLALQGSSAMHGGEDRSSRIRSFTGSHRYVLDYLIEEVLEQQPESIQTFLLQTSVLERMSGSLCDAVTTQEGGQALLEALDRSNLFVVPLDGERRWYRYHRLFADLLRQRLDQTGAGKVPILHLRACEWYRQNGLTEEAVEHALHGQDFQRVADLIEESVAHVLHFGEHTRLRRWLGRIPVEVTRSRPHLCILQASYAYIGGQVDEAERYLQAAEQVLDRRPLKEPETTALETDQRPSPDTRKVRGRMAVVRSFLVSYAGDVEGSVRYARQALEYLPKNDSAWRCSAFDSIGTAYSSIDDVSAYQARAAALEEAKATGSAYMILFGSLRLVVTLRDLGRLEQAMDIGQQQLKLAQENGLSQTALVGWLYTLWAEILAERDELDTALELANKGVELTERGNDVILLGSSYMCLLRVLFSRGDWDSAESTIQEVANSGLYQQLSPWILNQLAAWQARIRAARGNLDEASRWAAECHLDIDGELLPVHDFDYVVLARILIAQERSDEASRLLTRLLEAAEAGGRTSKSIELLVLQALAFQAGGQTARALAALERALTIAEPGGFVRIFADEGPPMARLLERLQRRGPAAGYIARILPAFETTGAGPQKQQATPDRPSAVHRPSSGLVELLSDRELEVLELIAHGLTNREIASRLFLSLNTVKSHTRNIYGKLGVHSRTQALVRARAADLLPPT